MKPYIPTLSMILGILIGAVSGHYHGKASVYADMFEQHAMIAEMINE